MVAITRTRLDRIVKPLFDLFTDRVTRNPDGAAANHENDDRLRKALHQYTSGIINEVYRNDSVNNIKPFLELLDQAIKDPERNKFSCFMEYVSKYEEDRDLDVYAPLNQKSTRKDYLFVVAKLMKDWLKGDSDMTLDNEAAFVFLRKISLLTTGMFFENKDFANSNQPKINFGNFVNGSLSKNEEVLGRIGLSEENFRTTFPVLIKSLFAYLKDTHKENKNSKFAKEYLKFDDTISKIANIVHSKIEASNKDIMLNEKKQLEKAEAELKEFQDMIGDVDLLDQIREFNNEFAAGTFVDNKLTTYLKRNLKLLDQVSTKPKVFYDVWLDRLKGLNISGTLSLDDRYDCDRDVLVNQSDFFEKEFASVIRNVISLVSLEACLQDDVIKYINNYFDETPKGKERKTDVLKLGYDFVIKNGTNHYDTVQAWDDIKPNMPEFLTYVLLNSLNLDDKGEIMSFNLGNFDAVVKQIRAYQKREQMIY